MSLLINIPDRPLEKLVNKLTQFIPAEEIEQWPDVSDPQKVKFALVWKQHQGSLLGLPNLKGISSFGAGVDSILADTELPNVPIARIVDESLATDMAKFVFTMIQHHKLRLNQFANQQQTALWKPKSARRGNRVGVLGFGQLGQETAKLLVEMGFDVSAWGRSVKRAYGIECSAGQDNFEQLIATSDFLVCLLPLTTQTENILDKRVFELMPEEAALINVARGNHLVEQELVRALNNKQLAHAYLDVFRQEPLPAEHIFWQHPNITITPHISAVTNVDTAVAQIVANYNRIKAGEPMLNCIDRGAGY